MVSHLEVAQSGRDELDDFVLATAKATLQRRFDRLGVDGMGRQLLDAERDHAVARPNLALVDDPDRFEEILDAGALGQDAARSGLECPHRPCFAAVGAGQDHPGPWAGATQLAADHQSPVALRIHDEDIRRTGADEFSHGGCRCLHQYDQGALLEQDAPESGAKQRAVAEESDTDRGGPARTRARRRRRPGDKGDSARSGRR